MKALSLLTAAFTLLLISTCTKEKSEIEKKEIISWEKPCNYKFEGATSPSSLTATLDNGFIETGDISFYDANMRFGFVNLYDANGDTLWERKFQVDGYFQTAIYNGLQISEDQYLLAGICRDSSYNDYRFLAWLDANGNMTRHVFLSDLNDYHVLASKVFKISGNGICYVSSVVTKAGSNPILRMEFMDDQGQVTGLQDHPNGDALLHTLHLVNGDRFLMAGSTGTPGYPDNEEMYFLVLNTSGDQMLQKTFGSDSWDLGFSSCLDQGNGYVFTGTETYQAKATIYPIDAAGETGTPIVIADSLYVHKTFLAKATAGTYVMFLLTSKRMYIIKLGADFKPLWISWKEISFEGFYTSLINFDIVKMEDGSFAFHFINNEGIVIIKTKVI